MNLSHRDRERWDRLIRTLRSELKQDLPIGLESEKGFTRIDPEQNDFDACFRAWWLEDVRRLPNGLILVTTSADEKATEAGIEKYKKRLVLVAQRCFLNSEHKSVTFKLLHPPAAAAAPTLVDLVLTAQQTAAPPANQWDEVKAEIRYRIEHLPSRESGSAMDYFRQAIEPVTLQSVEMDGDKPVWKLLAPMPKKTRGVMSLLKRQVNGAIRKVASAEVQIVVAGLEGGV